MKLYEAIRWGNDSDDPTTGGANGLDTCFLVRADSLEEAAALADRDLAGLARLAGQATAPSADAMYLIGEDHAAPADARLLRGPYFQNAYRHGWRHWYRDASGEPWRESPLESQG